MESIYLEKQESKESANSGVVFEKKPNLTEVSDEIFDEHHFDKGDVILLDNDETLIPTWEYFLLNKSFENIPKDSQFLLEKCTEKEVRKAIVTNMPREGHYMNDDIDVFGYQYHSQDRFLKKVEFPVSLLLGSLYKEGEKCLYEIAVWSVKNEKPNKKIAWIGNSYFDQGFGYRLEKTVKAKE